MSGHFSSLLALPEAAGQRIPVTVLTGFLGSGKTTLLNRLLALPDLHGTAVIVNEFGAVGIDQDLTSLACEDTVLLANGCLCCSVRGDLVEALERLALREQGAPRRVLIETSGLADPGPILRSFLGEPAVRARYALAGVACTVDAVLGSATLAGYPEAVRQLAVADLVLLTKTDLLGGAQPAAQLLAQVQAINGEAPQGMDPAHHVALLQRLMSEGATGQEDAAAGMLQAPGYRAMAPVTAPVTAPAGAHRDGISSFVLQRDEPCPRRRSANGWTGSRPCAAMTCCASKASCTCRSTRTSPWSSMACSTCSPAADAAPLAGCRPAHAHRLHHAGLDAQALDDTLSVLVRRHRRRAPNQDPG